MISRGDVWLVNLDPTIGQEIKKTRPAVVVSSNSIGRLPLKIIVPITDWKPPYANYPWMVYLEPNKQNGLSKKSGADTFQVRSIDQSRLVKKLGLLLDPVMEEIRRGSRSVSNISDRRCGSCSAPGPPLH